MKESKGEKKVGVKRKLIWEIETEEDIFMMDVRSSLDSNAEERERIALSD